jgi:hypothetical protein
MRISVLTLLCLSLGLTACNKAPQNPTPTPVPVSAPASAAAASTAPAAVSAAAPGTSAAAQASTLAPDAATTAGPEVAGQVALAQGSITDTAKDGSSRQLKDGDSVYPGDSFVLGADSYLDLDLEDTGRILLRPNTSFQIQSYHYDADAHDASAPTDANGQPLIKPASQQPENAFFKLIKGGLRAVDGLIGKTEPQNYAVETPVATIGVRGTAFDVRYCGDDCADETDSSGKPENGLYTSVTEGSVGIKNDSGETVTKAGQSGFVKSRKEKMQALAAPPKALRHMGLPDTLKARAEKNRGQIQQRRQQRRQAILQHRREQAAKPKAADAAAKPAEKQGKETPAERRQERQEQRRGAAKTAADKGEAQKPGAAKQRREERGQKPAATKPDQAGNTDATLRQQMKQQRQEKREQRQQQKEQRQAPAEASKLEVKPEAKQPANGEDDKCKDKKQRGKDKDKNKDKCGGD